MNNIALLQTTKICPRCKILKVTFEFNKCKSYKDGLSYVCRDCNREERKNRKSKIKEYHAEKYKTLNDKEYILKNIRANASRKGETTDITIDDIPTIPSFCPIFGIPISVKNKNRNNAISVDRIDNTKGYVKGNIVLVSFKANVCKNSLSIDEIEKLYLFYKQFKPE